MTSNLEFGQWTSICGDTKLMSALVDRLVHHAHVLSFTGESFRNLISLYLAYRQIQRYEVPCLPVDKI
uniref:ATP-binding protein n=1 Tax=Paenibacillus profundus TaxID=1173085 RepID=UPI002D7E2073|nr:ATP-binding protein [Paenibacillus profundus]